MLLRANHVGASGSGKTRSVRTEGAVPYAMPPRRTVYQPAGAGGGSSRAATSG